MTEKTLQQLETEEIELCLRVADLAGDVIVSTRDLEIKRSNVSVAWFDLNEVRIQQKRLREKEQTT